MVDHRKQLADLGLTQYECQAYQALLHQSPLSAGDVSKITGIPQGKVYSVLDGLVREGFCVIVPGRRKRFSAVSPKAAVRGLVETRRQAEIEWEQRVKTAADELDRQYQSRLDIGSSADYVSVYTTPESMKTRFWELCLASQKIIRAFNKPPYMLCAPSSTARKDCRNLDALRAKGTEVRTILELEKPNPEKFRTFVGTCIRGGQSIRINEKLPLKLHIFDQDAVLLTLIDHPFCRRMCYSLLITHAAYASTMIELFEMYWRTSKAFDVRES